MPMRNDHSKTLFTRAQALLPGGVNSPVRAFKSVGGTPFFVERAEGPYLFDVDGNRYIDYVGSWGPMIVGHNHPKVLEAVIATARNGLSFGTPNPLEVTMAETITRLMPSMEMVRMVNSGTEATLSAIRLARGATGRMKISSSGARGAVAGMAALAAVVVAAGGGGVAQPASASSAGSRKDGRRRIRRS